ncbi:conserved hypothetical protein [Tenacibaculum sediminilitoris]|uniref:2TM domain-containing protein n=1 Tax=Tenacibaculum sediminilitoris TaxID=1820334 RepID=UPI0038937BA6
MNVDNKRLKAELRVQEIKDFYKHVITYIIVNLFFTLLSNYFNIMIRIYDDIKISNKVTDNGFEHYSLWGIWGIILIIDAFKVFGFRKLFGKDWEENKIKEFTNNVKSN